LSSGARWQAWLPTWMSAWQDLKPSAWRPSRQQACLEHVMILVGWVMAPKGTQVLTLEPRNMPLYMAKRTHGVSELRDLAWEAVWVT
jgi:hypothetical protein